MNWRMMAAAFAVAALSSGATAQEAAKPEEKAATTPAAGKAGEKSKDSEPKGPKIERATFGGGCFWSVEAVFERLPGVRSVTSGFAGGDVPNPSYQQVCTGQTGHAEVVQVEYDASVIPYEKLLQVFWKVHDPTTPNAQGDDFGPQYRSIILYQSETQRQAALKSYRDLKARRAFRGAIVTQLVPLNAFYPAEPYHQDYFRNHLDSEYSQFYIVPKLAKMKLIH